jgi:hypothetical protein
MAAMHIEGALIGARAGKRQGQLCGLVQRPCREKVGQLEMPPPNVVIAGAFSIVALLGSPTGIIIAVVDHLPLPSAPG